MLIFSNHHNFATIGSILKILDVLSSSAHVLSISFEFWYFYAITVDCFAITPDDLGITPNDPELAINEKLINN